MGEQQSQKRGVRSEAQKTERAREGYDPLPPSQPVAGAFGEHRDGGTTDQELALRLGTKHTGVNSSEPARGKQTGQED
jgi:hypothetical protein